MHYISTRGGASALDFQCATLTGLASDGVLYLPESCPPFRGRTSLRWQALAMSRRPSASCCLLLATRLTKRSCATRSEEHTSELQSLMRISYAVFCLKKKKTKHNKKKNNKTKRIHRRHIQIRKLKTTINTQSR